MRGEAAGLCRLNAAGICEASPSCVRRRIRQPARQCRFRLLRTQLLRRHSRRPMGPRASSSAPGAGTSSCTQLVRRRSAAPSAAPSPPCRLQVRRTRMA
ncbi:LOL1 [Zea mays]|uniref:LOL1 n=1 Tax=Zea mays TaxID=4577 RepID=A0A1D6PVV5_MAIZE|nr:LOL1 [Zea mays]